MGWDPFKIEQRHRETREAIDAGKPGYAQSEVSGTMVSLEFDGRETELRYVGLDGKHAHDIIEDVVVGVATGKGRASPRTFHRSFVEHLVAGRRAFSPGAFKSLHTEADRLEALLRESPQMFV